ncbi:sortase [Novosphingobium sp. G106]|uniref:sortase domain-containing protein n=1 Tax=Novosphingobium sp. G106 TaxID=2849500 RepID=UPI001C2DE4D2|nr:sortase [Novosphingobium sp. G106]MBV1691239.1 sortase [Novosphingobium sp. G106]
MIRRLTPIRNGGRAAGRALFLGVCAIGLITMAQGAWIPVKAQVAQVLLGRAFDASLAEHRPVKPWPWADTAPAARVSVKRLGVSDVVLSGGSGQAMAFGPTELRGNDHVTVLAAHRDTHFEFVRDLRAGDEVVVERIDGTHQRYRVTGFQTVRWDRFAVPGDPARPMLALATCWPFGATEHGPMRRVAWAELI